MLINAIANSLLYSNNCSVHSPKSATERHLPPTCSMRFVNYVHQRGMRSITQSITTVSP